MILNCGQSKFEIYSLLDLTPVQLNVEMLKLVFEAIVEIVYIVNDSNHRLAEDFPIILKQKVL